MRKKDDTLRASLLALTRETMDEKGVAAISIRSLAEKAGVSVGTVYNYFTGKEDILLALTEILWRDALRGIEGDAPGASFVEDIRGLYAHLRGHMNDSARTLMNSLRGAGPEGRERMHALQGELRAMILRRLARDAWIPDGIWRGVFTMEAYAGFVVMNLLVYLRTDAPDISFFLELMQRTLYDEKGAQ